MGERAILTWLDDHGHTVMRLYQHWSSPSYQIPNLAVLVHEEDGFPTPVDYLAAAYRETDRLDLPREPYSFNDDDPGDLDHRYTVRVRYNPPRLYVKAESRKMGHTADADRWNLIYESDVAAELYAAAAEEREQMAKRARQVLARNPGSLSRVPDPTELDEHATDLRRWAKEATS